LIELVGRKNTLDFHPNHAKNRFFENSLAHFGGTSRSVCKNDWDFFDFET